MWRLSWPMLVAVVAALLLLAYLGQRSWESYQTNALPDVPPGGAVPGDGGAIIPPAANAIPPSRIDEAGGDINPTPSGTPDVPAAGGPAAPR